MNNNNEFNINLFIDSFLNCHHEINNLLFENTSIFHDLAKFVNEQTQIKKQIEPINWYKVSKTSLLQNLKLIDNFYHSIGVDFKTDNVIKDGTFNILTNNLDETINNESYKLLEGYNNYKRGHKSIDIYNNGLITDSIVWVHEISHYRNQPDEERNQVNDLLTESLAYTEELIYLDYLEKMGYTYEAYHIKYILLNTFHYVSYEAYMLTKMYLLYQELGDTSKESYKYYYGYDEDYDEIKTEFINAIKENQDAIFNAIWNTVSGALSVYMYQEYQNDNKFMNNIEELNNCLLHNENIKNCLKTIRLKGYNSESLKKIKEAYDKFKKDLEVPSARKLKNSSH